MMIGSHKDAGGKIFLSSMQGLANLLAFIVTFFLTGRVEQASVGWATRYALDYYGADMAALVASCWFLVCGIGIFFLARATLATALMMGAVAIVTRFF